VVRGGLKETAQLYSAQILRLHSLRENIFTELVISLGNVLFSLIIYLHLLDEMMFYLSLLYEKQKKNIPGTQSNIIIGLLRFTIIEVFSRVKNKSWLIILGLILISFST